MRGAGETGDTAAPLLLYTTTLYNYIDFFADSN